MFCKKCGKKAKENDKFCDSCGNPITINNNNHTDSKKADYKSLKMDKSIKISIIAGIIVVALSIAYYSIIFLPAKESRIVESQKQEQIIREQQEWAKKEEFAKKELENKKVKCSEDAKKFHNDYIETVDGYYFEPKYTYNKNLETCIYSGGYRNRRSHNLSITDLIDLGCIDNYDIDSCGYWERFVKDIYTNKDIITIWPGVTKEALNKFWDKHAKLFE